MSGGTENGCKRFVWAKAERTIENYSFIEEIKIISFRIHASFLSFIDG